MNGIEFVTFNGPQLVHGLSHHVHDPSQGRTPYRNLDGISRIQGLHTAHQAIRGVHGDTPDNIVPKMLRNLHNQVPLRVTDRGV